MSPPSEQSRRADSTERIPLSRIRRRIGDHMVKSLATSAHVTVSVDVDYSAIDGIRRRVGARWRAMNGFSLSYLPFVARVVGETLGEFGDLNASIEGRDLVRWGEVHVGVAVDLSGRGLVVPVIRHIRSLSLDEIAHGVNDLSQRASSGELGPNDVQGGTFTISSQGVRGADRTSPIINQPQVAILSIDAIRQRPVVVEHGSIVARPVGALSLSFDHRAVDGVYASAFLRSVQAGLEAERRGPKSFDI